MAETILFLSEQDVADVLTPGEVIGLVKNAFIEEASEKIQPKAVRLNLEEGKRKFFMGFPVSSFSKNITSFKWYYGCESVGQPYNHGSVILLSDNSTGNLLSIMGGAQLSAMRTAGGHAVVAAEYLTADTISEIAVIGSGRQARAGIRGLSAQFPSIRKIRLYTRRKEAYEALISKVNTEAEIVHYTDIQSAVKNVPLVLMATSAGEKLLMADWISDGTTVLAISGLSDLDQKLFYRADKWVIGKEDSDVKAIYNQLKADQTCAIPVKKEFTSLPDIILHRKPGRENDKEIILYTHMGQGIFDLVCAFRAYENALKQNKGQKIVLDQEI